MQLYKIYMHVGHNNVTINRWKTEILETFMQKSNMQAHTTSSKSHEKKHKLLTVVQQGDNFDDIEVSFRRRDKKRGLKLKRK